MGDIIKHGTKFYSISDQNEQDEFVVLKITIKNKTKFLEDARIIQAVNLAHCKTMIRKYPFRNFKKLPDADMENIKTIQ